MTTALLTRRLAGLSICHTRAAPLSGALSLKQFVQPGRALSSLSLVGANGSSLAPAPRTVHPDHSAGTRVAAVRWMSLAPTPSALSQGDEVYDSSAAADAEGEELSRMDSRLARSGRGVHPNGDLRPPKYRKVKPHIVKRRMKGLRTYIGAEKNIRYSPWRMNLICQFAAGQTVVEAENQLRFVRKRKAPLMRKVLRRTANLADIRDGLQPSQLEVAECFATHGHHLRRLKIHARGKSGIMHHRHCHIRLVLREIDFPLKVALATTEHQKRRWLQKMRLADIDAAEAKAEREELERLEREAEAKRAKEEEAK